MRDHPGTMGGDRSGDLSAGQRVLRHLGQKLLAEGEEAVAEIGHVGIVEDADEARMAEEGQRAGMVGEVVPEMRHHHVKACLVVLAAERLH